MTGCDTSLYSSLKVLNYQKIQKVSVIATSKFPKHLIDQSNRIWSETFTANRSLKSRQSHRKRSKFIESSFLCQVFYFSRTFHVLLFSLINFFLPLSLSGQNDRTTGIYERSLSVFFLWCVCWFFIKFYRLACWQLPSLQIFCSISQVCLPDCRRPSVIFALAKAKVTRTSDCWSCGFFIKFYRPACWQSPGLQMCLLFYIASLFSWLSSHFHNFCRQRLPIPAMVGHAGSSLNFTVVQVDSHLAYKCFFWYPSQVCLPDCCCTSVIFAAASAVGGSPPCGSSLGLHQLAYFG